jgi:hypothetical protein
MPFLQEGGPIGSIGSGLPAARLVVDRDKVLALKRGFEDELVRVREWLSRNARTLSYVPPPGCDPCSGDASKALGQNGESAIAAIQGYVDQLEKVARALGDIAIAYGLTEDANTRRLERKCR